MNVFKLTNKPSADKILYLVGCALIGAIIGIVAMEIYLHISYAYFYIAFGLWNENTSPVINSGLYCGVVLGLVVGFSNITVTRGKPFKFGHIVKNLLCSIFLMLGASLLFGVIASVFAFLLPISYRRIFLLPLFDDNETYRTICFTFVNGSILGWYLGAISLILLNWYKVKYLIAA